ncbi:extracellular solute-binding protein [Solwaraspora sp. WMMA2101]|uniref:extracellular solute-binding protein n=1 Tax=Solwaraspora sp. WMMA2101 TaxID=3404124 RepID=UPI003B9548D4
MGGVHQGRPDLRRAGDVAGHPIYYNKALYEAAGLDPTAPATTWDQFVDDCATITGATGAKCIALGNKEGFGIQFFLSGLASGILTPDEYDAWIDENATGIRPTSNGSSSCGKRPATKG